MKATDEQYVERLSRFLSEHANVENARLMKKYMKELFPFFGIKAPERKILFSTFIQHQGFPLIHDVYDVVRMLFDKPERELHYFAIELADKFTGKFDHTGIKLFEYMIVNNSWWDTVDFIAAHSLGKFFKKYSELILPVSQVWMDSGNIWLQRSCILFQLKYKKNIDLELLYSFISKIKNSNEFFIQKAIGWILREYSKINPAEIERFVESTQLKPLSKREALRIIKK